MTSRQEGTVRLGCRPSRASARSAHTPRRTGAYGSEDDRVRRGSPARPRTRYEPARRRREGNPRPQGPERGSREEVGSPTITNDGVSIAKEIELEDPWE